MARSRSKYDNRAGDIAASERVGENPTGTAKLPESLKACWCGGGAAMAVASLGATLVDAGGTQDFMTNADRQEIPSLLARRTKTSVGGDPCRG